MTSPARSDAPTISERIAEMRQAHAQAVSATPSRNRRGTNQRQARRFAPSPVAASSETPLLSPHYARLLRDGGESGQDLAYRVAFGALCAGWNEHQLLAALLDPRNASGLEIRTTNDNSPQAALRAVQKLLERAQRYADEHEGKREEGTARTSLANVIATADALVWKGEAALTDLCALHTLVLEGASHGRMRVGMSARDLGGRIGCTTKTANLATQRLCADGWLSPAASGRADHALEYDVQLPDWAPHVRLLLPPMPLELSSHPAFFRAGVGRAGLRMLQVMSSRPSAWWTVKELVGYVGLSDSVVRRRLEHLVGLELADKDGAEGVQYRANQYDIAPSYLAWLASQFGTEVVAEQRRTRDALERDGYAAMLAQRERQSTEG